MEILIWSAIFVVSLTALIFSADRFTTSAEKIGLHFRIPPFIIGVTILALGTSLPELATSIVSAIRDHSEIVIGDVAGSNIANILLVLSISAIIAKKLKIERNIIHIDLPFVFGSTILLYLFTTDGIYTWKEGIVSLTLLVVYLIYNALSHREVEDKERREQASEKRKLKKEKEKTNNKLGIKYPLLLVISGILLYFSADYTVQSIVKLAELLNIGKEIVAVSAVAIGTSLPELVVSAIAAKRGKAGIAIGNVMGSNVFNALGVMGGASIASTITIPEEMITFTIPFLILVTALYIFISMDREVSRWEGYIMLIIYIAFMGMTFNLL